MFAQIMLWIKSLGLSEEGQGLAEYALIIALVAIVLIGGLGVLAGGIENVFDTIVAAFP